MKKSLLILLVLVVVFFIWNFNKGTQQSKNSDTIKIGFVGPLTGDVSSSGIPTQRAVELAVKEINNVGGINGKKVELISEDGVCNSKNASAAGAKLINVDKVVGIIGGFCSGESSSFGPSAMQNKVVMISPGSSSPTLSKLGKYFFRVYPSDEFQGKFAAEYAFKTLNVKAVAVVYGNTDWGTGIKNVFVKNFEALGGKVVLDEGVAQDSRDFRTIVGKIRNSNADFVFSPLYTEGATAFTKQINDMGVKVKILGADSWSDTKFQNDIDGALGAQYIEVKTGSSDEFTNKFKTAYPDLKIGFGVPQAYDATQILLNAIKAVGTDDKAKLSDTVRATKFDGISGHIEFDQNGDMLGANYVIKKLLGNGKTEEVK
jgi:branched-chain amino acid transport system substrate-binding protein